MKLAQFTLLVLFAGCTRSHDVLDPRLSSSLHREADGGGSELLQPEAASGDTLKFSDIGSATVVDNQLRFPEGPVWDPNAQVLYFTDIDADAIYRLKLPDQRDTLVSPANHPDGLALDQQGALVVAGYQARSIERVEGTQLKQLVSEYQGQALNSPDDVVVRSDGTVYFTDPTFGLAGQQASLSFQGIYRLDAGGALELEDQTTSEGPNGIEFSPDEKTLYVSFTVSGAVAKYDVQADGKLGPRASFASGVLSADSMCVDAAGDLYVATFGGLAVLSPSGTNLGTIPTMNLVTTNCAFGGPDLRTLFITAHSLTFGTSSPGDGALLRIDDMPIPGLPGRP